MKNTTWWAPIWRGLVVDPTGIHCRSMKNALWLYLYLILHADRRTGSLNRKLSTVAGDMGLSEKTLRKWLRVLKTKGYLGTRSNGRCTQIVISKWKTLSESAGRAGQNHSNRVLRPPENGQSAVGQKSEITLVPEEKTARAVIRYDRSIKKTLNNDTMLNPRPRYADFCKSSVISLAVELSQALGDPTGLAFYVATAKQYSEDRLRSILIEVMKIPDNKIKTSRGALFNHLVRLNSLSTDSPHDVHGTD